MTKVPPDKDWKLHLRYGKLKTEFTHFTVLADGIVGQLVEGFTAPPGPAWMAMKVWASSTDEATDMAYVIGKQIGFTVTGRTHVYDTEPSSPPSDKPSAYDINFKNYDEISTILPN
jgi:hypothetical protein